MVSLTSHVVLVVPCGPVVPQCGPTDPLWTLCLIRTSASSNFILFPIKQNKLYTLWKEQSHDPPCSGPRIPPKQTLGTCASCRMGSMVDGL